MHDLGAGVLPDLAGGHADVQVVGARLNGRGLGPRKLGAWLAL
jgi:hypothetical protein